MKIIAVNAGSSSLKFKLFEMPEEKLICFGLFERIGLSNSFYIINFNEQLVKKEIKLNNHEEAVKILVTELKALNIIEDILEIDGIGHRVVHGKDKYRDSVIIDDEVIKDIDDFSYLAPLHNPANVIGIKAFLKLSTKVKAVAVFDTAFHHTIKEEAYIYPIPYNWYLKYGVRKYGFHGISHNYIALQISDVLANDKLKIISCHLGNGSSLCAIKDMKSIDTTMGFTPLSGLPMGTRCGDIDPFIISYMIMKTGKKIDQIMDELNEQSGFLGISGLSADVRDIEIALLNGDKRAKLAYDIYIRKVVSFIASYNTLLDKADVICFTAGIGERAIKIRQDIINKLSSLGIELDQEKNNIKGKLTEISTPASKIRCFVVPTDEELLIAKETYELLK